MPNGKDQVCDICTDGLCTTGGGKTYPCDCDLGDKWANKTDYIKPSTGFEQGYVKKPMAWNEYKAALESEKKAKLAAVKAAQQAAAVEKSLVDLPNSIKKALGLSEGYYTKEFIKNLKAKTKDTKEFNGEVNEVTIPTNVLAPVRNRPAVTEEFTGRRYRRTESE